MTRLAVGFDRTMTAVVGLALIVLGTAAVCWQRGALGHGWPLKLVPLDTMQSTWWPWVSAAAGVVLILLGLRWLVAHRWAPKVSRIGLGDAGDPALTADASSAAHAAGTVLGAAPSVLKASGTATVERGTPTVTLSMTVPAGHAMTSAVSAADDTARTVAAMLGDNVAVRTVIRVDAKAHSALTPEPVSQWWPARCPRTRAVPMHVRSARRVRLRRRSS